MFAHALLNGLGEQRGVADGVGFGVARLNQGQRRSEGDLVLANRSVPNSKCWNYSCSCLQGNARETARSAGRDAEKIDEHSLWRRHIRVHENADGFASTHCAEQAARKVAIVKGHITMQRTVSADEAIHQLII